MKKFFQIYSRITIFLIFLLALAILITHFVTIIYGFYFTGDTVTYFVPAFPGRKGDLLAVFAWHMNNYPPFVSFALNLLRFLPVSFITQHQIYLILSTLLSTLVIYLIVRKVTPTKKWQVILLTLLLFTGSQSLMFQLALAEPLFIFFWLLIIFTVERFISTKKERYLLLFVISAGLLPIVKLQGASILLSFEIILILFTYFTWREKKYSVCLVFTSLILAWIPLFMNAVMNYLLHQSFFGYFDPQSDLNGKRLSYQLMHISTEVLKDSFPLLLSGLILGTQIKWNKNMKNFIILAGFSALTYYFFVALGLSKIAANEALRLRYFLPPYPELILVAICIGSIIIYKRPKLYNKITLGLIFVIFIFGYNLSLSINRLDSEIKSPQSILKSWVEGTGAEHSTDIRRFCRGKTKNKYLLLKDSSRNWIAQSLGYYCQPIENIQMEKNETFDLPKDSLIFTPYKIVNSNLKKIDLYKGAKEVILYKTDVPTKLDVKEILKELKFLD